MEPFWIQPQPSNILRMCSSSEFQMNTLVSYSYPHLRLYSRMVISFSESKSPQRLITDLIFWSICLTLSALCFFRTNYMFACPLARLKDPFSFADLRFKFSLISLDYFFFPFDNRLPFLLVKTDQSLVLLKIFDILS